MRMLNVNITWALLGSRFLINVAISSLVNVAVETDMSVFFPNIRLALHEMFLNLQLKYHVDISTPLCLKPTSPYFVTPFFKEQLNVKVRINKTVNKHSVNYHRSPSV